MSERDQDWTKWQDAWRVTADPRMVRLPSGPRRVRHADALQMLVAVAGIVLVALALRHAASPFEFVLGASVVAAIAAVWLGHARGRARETMALKQDAVGHLASLREVRRRELRLVRFVGTVLVLELVFLTPWWAGGFAAHGRAMGSPIAIIAFWVPLVAIAGLFAWIAQLRHRASAELGRIDQMEQSFTGPSTE